MATWQEVLTALNEQVVVSQDVDLAREITRILLEPDDDSSADGCLVLCVHATDSHSLVAALTRQRGTSTAVLGRMRGSGRSEILRAAQECNVNVALIEDQDWVSVIERLGPLIAGGPRPHLHRDDIFNLADEAAEIIGGPVTIEDRNGDVVAYAGDHAHADSIRIATILARRAPAPVTASLHDAGVLRRIEGAKGAVVVHDVPGLPGLMPRVAAPIRSGGETVGTAWAIASAPSEDRCARYLQCVGLAALPLVQLSAERAAPRSLDLDGLAALLYGGAGSARAIASLGLTTAIVEVGVLAVRESDPAATVRSRGRLRTRLLATSHLDNGVLVGDFNGRLYVVAPVKSARGRSAGVLGFLQDHHIAEGLDLLVGIGRPVPSRATPRSRHESELALAVLRVDPSAGPVAEYEQVWAISYLQRVAGSPAAASLMTSGPVAQLAWHDRTHRTEYVATLRAHLGSGGDARRAADTLTVHVNTYRHRMRRLHQLVEMDLTDVRTLAAVATQLSLLEAAPTA